jgi:hypothetical protein
MLILDPTNANPNAHKGAKALHALAGKRIAYLNNGWTSMGKIGRLIEEPLRRAHGLAEIVHFDVPRNTAPPGNLLERVAREFDGAIVGMAN